MNRKILQYSVLSAIFTLLILSSVGEAPALQQPEANADVSVSPRNGFAPLTVTIEVQVSPPSSPACIPDSFTISYGDGSPAESSSSNGQLQFGHTYTQPGTYFININYVRHQNFGGSVPDCVRASASASATVTVLTQSALQAQIVATPTTGAAPLTVQFDASNSLTDPNCPVENYDWDFGDGETGSGETTSHTYEQPALYTASLTLVDSCGRSDSASTEIDVNQVQALFNDIPVFNLPQEPAVHPACDCDEPTYTGGIAQVPINSISCHNCGMSGRYSGIDNDTGGRTVLLHSGEFVHYVRDLTIPGRGFDWSFERKYRSGVIYEGPIGHNWDFNYNRRIIPVLPSNLEQVRENFPNAEVGDLVRMDGFARADLFKLDVQRGDMSATFTSPDGFYVTLERLSNGGFAERDRNGTLAVYDSLSPGDRIAYLSRLTDRNGNTMRFMRNPRGLLTEVIDTLGRSIDYLYNRDERLITIRDFNNREIKFAYDDNGDLVRVTGPAVTGTPNSNDFPGGKLTTYTYSSGFNDDTLNHNLLSITAPNEVALGAEPRYVITYDENTNSPTADRVLSQLVGGTNNTNIPAGGTISYEYLGSLTRVTDRNGNESEYEFNINGNIIRIAENTNRDIRADEPNRYQTTYQYNSDGEMTRVVYPEGNEVIYSYDSGSPNRLQQGNLVSIRELPDGDRGGDQSLIQTNYTYEPIYNQIRSITEPRGNDPSYSPPNGGLSSPERYTTTYYFDYQEGDSTDELAIQLGLSESEVRELLGDMPINLGDLNGDGLTSLFSGNVIQIEHPAVELLEGHNQVVIEGSSDQPVVEYFSYNEVGQLVQEVDAEGNVTAYEYHRENDPDGDLLNPTPGVSSSPFGYLAAVVRDTTSSPERNSNTNPTPAAIRTEYLYDPVGNIVSERDGRGVVTEYHVNQLNQIVQIRRAADVSDALDNSEEPDWELCINGELVECTAGMEPFGYVKNIYYDANDNVIMKEIENSDSHNTTLNGAFVERTMRYDILDNLVELSEEVSDSPLEFVTTRYRYDANENRVAEISPLAVTGEQRSNVMAIEYDERDLPFEITRGGFTLSFQNNSAHADIQELNGIPLSLDVSTITKFYDGNRNIIRTLDAVDNSGDGALDETLSFYDGFDRLVSIVDPIGNQTFNNYDPAGNLVRHSVYGPVGGLSPEDNSAATTRQPMRPGNFSQPLLEQTEYHYDELSRPIRQLEMLFDYSADGVNYEREVILRDGPLETSDDGIVVTLYEYDRNGRLTFITEDDGDTFRNYYDGVGRVIRHVDPEMNEVLTTYDDNGNTVRIEEIDVTQRIALASDTAPDLTERFVSHYTYDSVNRLIRVVDNLGQTTRYHYDSRDNLITTTDAENSGFESDLLPDPLGLADTRINLPGNRVLHHYDGLDRHIAEVSELRLDGQGRNSIDRSISANRDGLVVVEYDYDANSRLIAQFDDGSQTGDQNTSIGLIESSDPLGNVTRYRFDDLNRLSEIEYDDGSIEGYLYDADDNVIRYVDANGSIHDNLYDGLNRIMSRDLLRASSGTAHPLGGFKDDGVEWEVVGSTIQEFEYDGLSRLTMSYDNNNPEVDSDDALVTRAYDSLGRLLEETQNGNVITSRWDGDDNRLELLYAGPREVAYSYDGLDRVDRIGDALTPIIAEYDYIGRSRVLERRYNNGTKLTYIDANSQNDIGYDDVRRIVELQHLTNSGDLLAGFEYAHNRANMRLSETHTHSDRVESYSYDSLYRMTEYEQGSEFQQFVLDGVNNWSSLNGTQTLPNNMNEYGAFEGRSQFYDDNGNLLDNGELRFTYDGDNRLREVSDSSTGALYATYSYDAHGRRIAKSITNAGDLDNEIEYLYDGQQVIEENFADMALVYLYGRSLDEPLTVDIDEGLDFEPDGTFYYHQDARNNVVAISDEDGELMERITYNPYGIPTITADSGGQTANPYLFAGRRYDAESGLYYFRARMYDPERGSFLQRDPIGIWSDHHNLGNGYTYVNNNPINKRDPMGNAQVDYFLHIPGVPGEPGGGGGGGGGGSSGGGGGCTCGLNCSCSPDPCCGKTCSCGDAMPNPGISVGSMLSLDPCPVSPRAKKIFIGGLSLAPNNTGGTQGVGGILRDFSGWTSTHNIPAQQECCGVSCSCQPPKSGSPGGYSDGPIIVDDDDD